MVRAMACPVPHPAAPGRPDVHPRPPTRPLVRFGLTDHPRELSWTVLRGLEDGLAPYFGDKWMEKR